MSTQVEPWENDEEPELEIEVVDDTPEEDQNRKPRAEAADDQDDLEKDIEGVSERVQKRIDRLKYEFHEERRAKEGALREAAAATDFARQALDKANAAAQRSQHAEEGFNKSRIEGAQAKLSAAKQKAKEAYDAGEADALIEAQEEVAAAAYDLKAAQAESERWDASKAQREHEQQVMAQAAQQVPQPNGGGAQIQAPDPRAVSWLKENQWFGSDEEMTAFAYGLHEKLVRNGVDPRSEDYYQQIDTRMREVFREHEWEDGGAASAQPERTATSSPKSSTVVAPASRGGGTSQRRTVQLTASEVSLAKKLGISPEGYARRKLEYQEQQANG
jgi:hypothetical protein